MSAVHSWINLSQTHSCFSLPYIMSRTLLAPMSKNSSFVIYMYVPLEECLAVDLQTVNLIGQFGTIIVQVIVACCS